MAKNDGMKKVFLENKVGIILNLLSLFFFIAFSLGLLFFVAISPPIIAILNLTLFLTIIPLVNLIYIFKKDIKINESMPLMRHRMNKYLTISIFCFSIGVPLLIDAYVKGGFLGNTVQTNFALSIIIFGLISWSFGYLRRDNIIEFELIRKNKMNSGRK